MFKLSSIFPLFVLKIMNYSLIYAILHYCNIINGGAEQTHIKPLVISQKKRVMRIFSGESYFALTNSLIWQQSILNFTDISLYMILLFMLESLNEFNTFLNHIYSTRVQLLIRPKFQRTTITQQNITYCEPSTWSSLPCSINKYTNLTLFSFEIV